MSTLFKRPKVPKPEDNPQTKALLDTSLAVLSDTDAQSDQLSQDYLSMASQDRSQLAQGAANVDTQMSLAGANDAALARAGSSGGLGSGASLGLYDAGLVGGALETARSGATNAELGNRGKNLMSAVKGVQGIGGDAFQGMRSAAQQGNAQALTNFKDQADARMQQLNMVVAGAEGFMKGNQARKTLDQNQKLIDNYNSNQTQELGNPYFNGISLAQPQYGPSYSGSYRPGGGMSFTNPNYLARPPLFRK